MKRTILITLCSLIFASFSNAQELNNSEIPAKIVDVVTEADLEPKTEIVKDEKSTSVSSDKAEKNLISKQTSTYQRPNSKERFNNYVRNTVGPFALLGTAFSAGIGTVANEPEEWEGNIEGFGRRFASNLGERAIRQTAIYGLDEALKLDSTFYRSQKKDFGSRLGNAMISTITARNKSGKRVVGVPRIVGNYSSAIIARETWYPKRFDYKDGLRSGTISFGTEALINVFREFVFK